MTWTELHVWSDEAIAMYEEDEAAWKAIVAGAD